MPPEPPTLSIEARQILLSRVWDLLLQPPPDDESPGEVSDPLDGSAEETEPEESD
jgi:hypothetical protein